MAFSTIHYAEPNINKYEEIMLHYELNGKHRAKKFKTGNIVVDFFMYMKFLANRPDTFYKENAYISGSSSWDHFQMDDKKNKYPENYFNPKTGEFIDWKRGLEKDATEEERQAYRDCCDNKYPRIYSLQKHKSFDDVKAYVKKELEKMKKAKLALR